MSVTVPTAAELAATNTLLQQTTARLTALEGNFKNLLAEVIADEAKIAALTPTVPPIVIPPVILPPYDPQVIWKAGMETGNVSEWSEEVNSGTADSVAVQAAAEGIPARTPWVLKQSVTGASGGTRMQRYPEVDALCRAGTKFYWTWWDYFPTPVSFSASGMYQIWGVLSIPTNVFNAVSDVFFSLGFTPTGNTLRLTYNPTSRASLAPKNEYVSPVVVPVGQWNKFEIEYLPRGDATGSFRLWMNQAQIFELLGIQTQYPLVGQAPLLTVIEQTGYGDVAFGHFVDDVSLSLGRMPT